jgi:hypothetical protein
VRRTFFCAIAIVAAIAIGPRGASAQATLNQNQGALYLACIGAASVGNLPINLTPNLYAAAIITNQSTVSQAESITSLQGLTFVQLGELINTNIKTYASKQLNCTHKCTNQVLTAFMTQSQASCLAIAQGYAP